MTDPARLEAIQAEKAEAARRVTHHQAVRRLLATLAPDNTDAVLSYRALLTRAQAVLTHELDQLGEDDDA